MRLPNKVIVKQFKAAIGEKTSYNLTLFETDKLGASVKLQNIKSYPRYLEKNFTKKSEISFKM